MSANSSNVHLYDSSMLKVHRRCRRKFYFRHIQDWEAIGSSPPLTFGTAWHTAMDFVWQNLPNERDPIILAQGAYKAFLDSWREQEMPPPDDEDCDKLAPRTPDVAANMLFHYVQQRPQFIRDCEVLEVERPFVVPIYPDKYHAMYCGRLDKVIRYRGRIWIVDHKTTTAYSRTQGFQPSFTDTFTPNLQIDGYAYAGHMLYGKAFKGVWIDAALVHKSQVHFGLIPVERRLEHLDAWMAEVRRYISEIEQDLTALNTEHFPLDAFVRNDDACYDWNRACPYLDICKMHADPTEVDMPMHLEHNHWSPLEHAGIVRLEDFLNA